MTLTEATSWLMASVHCSASSAFTAAQYVSGPYSNIMAMLILDAILLLLPSFEVSGGGVRPLT